MIKNIFVIIFLSMVFSCSVFTPEITSEDETYVLDILKCDSKSSSGRVLNMDEVTDFFNGEGGSVIVKYIYLDDDSAEYKSIEIYRGRDGDKRFYLPELNRITLPMTECNALKKERYYK